MKATSAVFAGRSVEQEGGGRWTLARSQPVSRQLPEIHSGQWAEMGNQQGKGGKRAAPGQTYPFDEPEKKSRTDWTAGKRPDGPP